MSVNSIAISRDGSKVLSCGNDKVLLWRFCDRRVEQVIHNYEVGAKNNCCCLSADERKVLFSDEDRLNIYDLTTNKIEKRLSTHGKIVSLLSAIVNNNCLYIARDAYGINYYYCENDELVNVNPEWTNVIGFNDSDLWTHYIPSTGKFLVYRKGVPSIGLYDENRQEIFTYPYDGYDAPIHVSFAEKEKLCAIAYRKSERISKVAVLNYTENQYESTTIVTDDIYIWSVAIASSGRWLSIWGSKNIFSKCIQNYQRMRGAFSYSKLSESEGGNLDNAVFSSVALHESFIFYGTNDGKITVDEIATDDARYYVYTHLDNHPPYVNSVAIIPGTERCLAAYEDGLIREWDFIGNRLIRTFERQHNGSVNCVAVAEERKLFITGGADGKVLLWDIEDSKPFMKVVGDISKNYKESKDVGVERIGNISFAENDRYVIASCIAGDIYIWDLENNEEEHESDENQAELIVRFERHKKSSGFIVYKIDNEDRIVSRDHDGNLFFGKVDFKGSKITEINYYQNIHNDRIDSVSFSDKTQKYPCIVTYGHDFTLKLWNADNGDFIKDIKETSSWGAVRFSPDGNKIYYVIKRDGKTHLMELDLTHSDCETKEFHSHHASGSKSSIVAYDKYVLTTANDGFIQVCDINGNSLNKLEVPRINIADFKDFSEYTRYEAILVFRSFSITYLGMPDVDLQHGLFMDWISNGKMMNIFRCIKIDDDIVNSPEYLDVFGSVLTDCTNDIQRIRILARSLIACTEEQQSYIEGEYELLESLMTYLYYRASDVEMNMPMLLELLSIEQSKELPLYNFFERLTKVSNFQYPNKLRDYFYASYQDTEKEISLSLIKRLRPLFRIYSETLPKVPINDIHGLSLLWS